MSCKNNCRSIFYFTFLSTATIVIGLFSLYSYEYKGKKFDVKNAKPKADAMATSKRSSETALDQPASKMQKEDLDVSCEGWLHTRLFAN